jgi:hypothetical protein
MFTLPFNCSFSTWFLKLSLWVIQRELSPHHPTAPVNQASHWLGVDPISPLASSESSLFPTMSSFGGAGPGGQFIVVRWGTSKMQCVRGLTLNMQSLNSLPCPWLQNTVNLPNLKLKYIYPSYDKVYSIWPFTFACVLPVFFLCHISFLVFCVAV